MNILDAFRLDGKTAVVTGCRRGIGKAIAIALADAGADILGVSANLEPEGSEVAREVTARGRTFRAFPTDLSNRKSVYELIDLLKAERGAIDILINNAGITQRSRILDHLDQDWERVIEVNQTAPFILSRELGRDMVQRRSGKIVFVASVLSFQGGIGVPAYAATKGALMQFMKALSNEWAPDGINVNAIVPGYISTDLNTALRDDPNRSRAILERIPAGAWGTPEDIAGAAVYLCSAAANYVHGTALVVDGGWMAR